jgi:formylglycine-generating enzyme required for sulfatase activity
MKISRPFRMMKRVVTQREWRDVHDSEPWLEERENYENMLGRLPYDDELQALNLSQVEAEAYAKEVGRRLGAPLSLVPEVFWEYACRAGAAGDYYWGQRDAGAAYEWLGWGSGTPEVHPPAQLKPNAWGLFDMCGNVNELILDRYPDSNSFYIPAKHYSRPVDFVARKGPWTVLRSANVMDTALSAGCGNKIINHSGSRQMFAGFRLAHIPWLSA